MRLTEVHVHLKKGFNCKASQENVLSEIAKGHHCNVNILVVVEHIARPLPPLWLFPVVSLPKYVPRNSEDKNGNNTSRFRHSTWNKKLAYLVARKKIPFVYLVISDQAYFLSLG